MIEQNFRQFKIKVLNHEDIAYSIILQVNNMSLMSPAGEGFLYNLSRIIKSNIIEEINELEAQRNT